MMEQDVSFPCHRDPSCNAGFLKPFNELIIRIMSKAECSMNQILKSRQTAIERTKNMLLLSSITQRVKNINIFQEVMTCISIKVKLYAELEN